MPPRNFLSQTKTKVLRKSAGYMEIAEDALGKDKKIRSEFQTFQDALKTLRIETGKYYTTDEKGNYPPITEENIKQLNEFYEDAEKKAKTLLNDSIKKGYGKDSSFYHSVITVYKFISSDRKLLNTYFAKPEGTLPDFIASGKTKYVDLKNEPDEVMKGSTSSRLPMKVKSGKNIVTGVFTQEFNQTNETAKDQFIAYINKLPDDNIIKCWINDEENGFGGDVNKFYTFLDKTFHIFINKDDPRKGECNIINKYNFEDSTDRYLEYDYKYSTLPEFNDVLEIFGNAKTSELYRNYLGIKPGDNIDKRNSAMTAVADILKMPDIIARSIPMAIKKENHTQKGTFMQFASGYDPDPKRMDPSSPLLKIKNGELDKDILPEVLQKISDLQILDFICGNVDRHGNNFFIDVKKPENEEENYKISSIQGIDNDLSFTIIDKKVLKGDKYLASFVGLRNMFFISQKTAEVVRTLTPEMLAAAISGFGLSEKAIKAACDRLELLKKNLSNKYLNNPEKIDPNVCDGKAVYVLTDAQISQLNFYDLAQRNVFGQLDADIRDINKENIRKVIEQNQPKEKNFSENSLVSGPTDINYDKFARRLGEQLQHLKDVNHGLFSSSPEFNNILAYGDYMQKVLAGLASNKTLSDDAKAAKAYEMFENLFALNVFYKNHKESDNTLKENERSRNRLLAVNSLQDMVTNYVERFGLDTHQQYRRLSEKQTAMEFNRKHDNAAIADAIKNLKRNNDAAEPNFNAVIDGISRKGWEKIIQSYQTAVESLNNQLKEVRDGLDETEMQAIFKNAKTDLDNAVKNINSYDENGTPILNGSEAMGEIRTALKNTENSLQQYLSKSEKSIDTLKENVLAYEMINLSKNAESEHAVPDYNIKTRLAQKYLFEYENTAKFCGKDSYNSYNECMTRIKKDRIFETMTTGKSEQKLKELLTDNNKFTAAQSKAARTVAKNKPKAVQQAPVLG